MWDVSPGLSCAYDKSFPTWYDILNTRLITISTTSICCDYVMLLMNSYDCPSPCQARTKCIILYRWIVSDYHLVPCRIISNVQPSVQYNIPNLGKNVMNRDTRTQGWLIQNWLEYTPSCLARYKFCFLHKWNIHHLSIFDPYSLLAYTRWIFCIDKISMVIRIINSRISKFLLTIISSELVYHIRDADPICMS